MPRGKKKDEQYTVVVIGTKRFVNLEPVEQHTKPFVEFKISEAEKRWEGGWSREVYNPFGSVRNFAQNMDYMCCPFLLVDVPEEDNDGKTVTMLASMERHWIRGTCKYPSIQSGEKPDEGKMYAIYHNHMGDVKIYYLVTFYYMEKVCGDVIANITFSNQLLAVGAVINFNLYLDDSFRGFKTANFGKQPIDDYNDRLCFEKSPGTRPMLYVERIYQMDTLNYNKQWPFIIYDDGTVMVSKEPLPDLARYYNYLIQLYGKPGSPLVGDRMCGVEENINRLEKYGRI